MVFYKGLDGNVQEEESYPWLLGRIAKWNFSIQRQSIPEYPQLETNKRGDPALLGALLEMSRMWKIGEVTRRAAGLVLRGCS